MLSFHQFWILGLEDGLKKKTRVLVLFGGQSGEHEVSLVSAASVIDNLDRERFDVLTAGIALDGRWLLGADALPVLREKADFSRLTAFTLANRAEGTQLVPVEGGMPLEGQVDVVFPVLHGPLGEDGTLQGMLEMMGLPYVGAGVLGSAVGMDKAVMKDVFRAHGIPTPPYAMILRSSWEEARQEVLQGLMTHLSFPMFVKPANMGSSVGISKAKDEEGLAQAIDLAVRYDRRVIIEVAVKLPDGPAREIEVAVLGNDKPLASVPGEVKPGAEFYDYDDKYHDGRAELLIPAPLSPELTAEVQKLARRAFLALDLAGMSRVDFLYGAVGDGPVALYVNEVNTIPGFTEISMYPKLWEASGLTYRDLLTRLIDLALERHDEQKRHRRT